MEAIEQLKEGEPEVGGGGAGDQRGEPEGPHIIDGARRPVCSSGAAGEPGEGAGGQVLHHAPLRHHARVLEGLASSFALQGLWAVAHQVLYNDLALDGPSPAPWLIIQERVGERPEVCLIFCVAVLWLWVTETVFLLVVCQNVSFDLIFAACSLQR